MTNKQMTNLPNTVETKSWI